MCRQAGSSPTIISSRSSKGSDYAEVPHGGWPENKVLANAMRHNPGYGIMAQLMEGRAVPVDRVGERLGARDLDVVARRHVEGLAADDADIGTGGADQGIGLWQDQRAVDGRDRRTQVLGQAFALVGRKDRVALQERDRSGRPVFLAGPFALLLRRVAMGIDHGHAALALADISAKLQRLAEGEEAVGGEAAFDHRAPQDQDVDPAVARAGAGIDRQVEGGGGRIPRLHPGHAPLLELGDDPVGDVLIEVGPLRCGSAACAEGCHGLSPRTDRPGATPSGFGTVTAEAARLSLSNTVAAGRASGQRDAPDRNAHPDRGRR
jgi:hypothetical protein